MFPERETWSGRLQEKSACDKINHYIAFGTDHGRFYEEGEADNE